MRSVWVVERHGGSGWWFHTTCYTAREAQKRVKVMREFAESYTRFRVVRFDRVTTKKGKP